MEVKWNSIGARMELKMIYYILQRPSAKCFLISANFPVKIFQIEKAYRCFLIFSLREFLFSVKRILFYR